MTSWIPSSIQKRLLRYALSHFPVVDTDTLDLGQLDIAWGKKSSVELRDVGLHVKKLSNVLQLPEELRVTTARVLSLRITVPADIYSSAIMVEVHGIDIQVQLSCTEERCASSGTPGSVKSEGRATSAGDIAQRGETQGQWDDSESDDSFEDYIPTAEQLAESFLHEEGAGECKELEEALQQAGRQHLEESEGMSESSDEDAGMGIGLSMPAFLANFLKGVVDRLQMTIHNVKFVFHADIALDEVLRSVTPAVSLNFGISSLEIEGFTRLTPDSAPEDLEAQGQRRRRVLLRNIYGDLVTDTSVFTSLERLNTTPSQQMSQSSVSPSQNIDMQSESNQDVSPSLIYGNDSGHEAVSSSNSQQLDSRSGTPQEVIRPYQHLESDRFADASDDGHDLMEDTSVDSQMYASSSLADSRIAPSEMLDEIDDNYPFFMGDDEDSHDYMNEQRYMDDGPAEDLSELMESSSGHTAHLRSDPAAITQAESFENEHSYRSLAGPGPSSQSAHANARTYLPEQHRASNSPSNASSPKTDGSASPASSEGGPGHQDLAQSMLFTHEEAESMYMSALSEANTSSQFHVPGGWGDSSNGSNEMQPTHDSPPSQGMEICRDEGASGLVTPRPLSPIDSPARTTFKDHRPGSNARSTASLAENSSSGTSHILRSKGQTSTKRLLSIDQISLWVPWSVASGGPEGLAAGEAPISTPSLPSDAAAPQPMPGAFSMYHSTISENAKSQRLAPTRVRFDPGTKSALPEESIAALPNKSVMFTRTEDPQFSIGVGHVTCNIDMSSTRLLVKLSSQVLEAWSDRVQTPKKTKLDPPPTQPILLFNFSLSYLTLSFFDSLAPHLSPWTTANSQPSSEAHDALFRCEIRSIEIENQSQASLSQYRIDVGKLRFGLVDEPIIQFMRPARKTSNSTRTRKEKGKEPAIRITYKNDSLRGPEAVILTWPVKVAVDISKLDDRLVSFGGVSGILDLSSSITSNSTVLAPPLSSKAKLKDTRFKHAAIQPAAPILSPIRINARIHGIEATLQGRSCAVQLETGTLAIVARQDHARVAIERIHLRAPYIAGQAGGSPISFEIMKTSLRFLVSGEEDDFSNLVALIEPSNDRFEADDNILLFDTLRNQRLNGSVLRIGVESVEALIHDLDCVEQLQRLGEEIGRLSHGVTKYLPEDDRPGILILPRLESLHTRISFDEKFGQLDTSFEDVRIAYVGVPFLVGFRIKAFSLSRNNEVLIDPLLSLELADPDPVLSQDLTAPSPMVMGRFIGNQPDSRFKVKLYNLLVDYKTSTISAVLGLSDLDTVEDLAASVIKSVATIRMDTSAPQSEMAPAAATSSPPEGKKPLNLDVAIRESAFGLNPAKSNAKALFLLTQSQLRIDESESDGIGIAFDIERANVLLIDDVDVLDFDADPRIQTHAKTCKAAVDTLVDQGFQSVINIWTTCISIDLSKDANAETIVQIDLDSKLFYLETCADSTHTLIQTLGDLAPPMAKKRQQIFRTHVVPIENMMASFTGEAFPQGDADRATNDDSDAEADDDFNMEHADHMIEDLPSNIEFMGSFYDPDDDAETFNASVLGSVRRSTASIFNTSSNTNTSFADGFQQTFQHSSQIPAQEDYVEVFKFKSPVRRWRSNRLEPVYEREMAKCPIKVTARFEQVQWNLYDGYDWNHTRSKIAQAVEKVEAQIEQRRKARRTSALPEDDESEIADMLFQSIWIAVPANADERDLRRGINQQINPSDQYSETASTHSATVDTRTTGGRPTHRRRKSKSLHLERGRRKISFELRNTIADFLNLPPDSEKTQSTLALRVGEFEIYDHVPSSTWSKFVTYMHDYGERQMGQPMIRIDAITIKEVMDLAATELILKVRVLPLRLHVDQDALDFVSRFFEFKDDRSPPSSGADGPYIARLEVATIPIKLDYKPKKVDYAGLRSGSTSEFANFIGLDDANLQLKHLILHGIQTPDLLQPQLKSIWTADVISTQLPTVLAGLAPIRPFVNVGIGIRDLVVVPMREYKKDGRIMRSVQKGAVAFAKTTTSEVARLGAKLAIGTQTLLEGAEGLLSPQERSSSRSRLSDSWDADDFSSSPKREEPRAHSNYADQPINVVTGVRDGWQGLERDLVTAKDAIIAIGGGIKDAGTASGAVGVVARGAPTIILRPAIGATRAVGSALMGVGNMLDRDSRRKIEDKYKRY